MRFVWVGGLTYDPARYGPVGHSDDWPNGALKLGAIKGRFVT
jgi:hypothetical protein